MKAAGTDCTKGGAVGGQQAALGGSAAGGAAASGNAALQPRSGARLGQGAARLPLVPRAASALLRTSTRVTALRVKPPLPETAML